MVVARADTEGGDVVRLLEGGAVEWVLLLPHAARRSKAGTSNLMVRMPAPYAKPWQNLAREGCKSVRTGP